MFFKNSYAYNIYYEDFGKKEDKAIIFLHAWGSDHNDFKYASENLEGYRRIIYDHRGFGQSDKPNENMSLRHLANDLKELIEYLELKDVVLVGYSMGACVVYKYLQIYGEDKISSIVICDMTPKVVSDKKWKYGVMGGRFGEKEFLDSIANQFDDMHDAYLKMYLDINPELKGRNNDALKRIIESDLKGNSFYSITSMWFSIGYEDFRDTIKKITLPTALFFANPGSLVNPETVKYLENNIKNTYTCLFEKSSHSFVNYKPKKFTRELELFLKTLK
ncbi:MAG: alpha/beta hydrolase [Peptostreptococcus sp.]|uniref:alpha/beta fold hydrolase n=1 Tax=Peptostreptococcus sp. TaxID=1262 RepID=UPI002FC7A428